MLPTNSTNDVVPGGPVSSVAGRNEIFGGGKMASGSNVRSTWIRSTIAGAGFFAGAVERARRILQHSVPVGWGCCLAGLEWNGQPLSIAFVFVASARNAQ